jgi:hypothetical protein
MNLRIVRIVVVLGAALALGLPAPATAAEAASSFMMQIPGGRFVTSPGELNPEALARVELREGTGEMCVTMRTVEVAPPMTVHLHQRDSDGPVLTTFFENTSDPNPQGCRAVGSALVRAIADNGFAYSLDIHSAGIPGGGTISGHVIAGTTDAFLTPEAVSPGPGDTDGTGIVSFYGAEKSGNVVVYVNTEGLTPPLTVNLHHAPQGEANGPLVTTLVEDATHDDPSRSFFLDRSLLRDINRNPGDYYIVVNSSQFPGGALRGQLER